MWEPILNVSTSGKAIKVRIRQDDAFITTAEFIALMKQSAGFRSFYNRMLCDVQYEGLFWEHPPMTLSKLHHRYECMLIEGNRFASLSPSPEAFRDYFSSSESVVHFPNLRGDAHLVVPCPHSDHRPYTHLVLFCRSAQEDQIDLFWKRVGEQYELALGDSPKWLNTAGMGVFWLHVRVDSRPKYYKFLGYKTP